MVASRLRRELQNSASLVFSTVTVSSGTSRKGLRDRRCKPGEWGPWGRRGEKQCKTIMCQRSSSVRLLCGHPFSLLSLLLLLYASWWLPLNQRGTMGRLARRNPEDAKIWRRQQHSRHIRRATVPTYLRWLASLTGRGNVSRGGYSVTR